MSQNTEKLFMKFPMFIFFSLLSLLVQPSQSTTILVDGVSEWREPTVHVGDTVIFKHKFHYNLYIFQNQRAFNLCNFTQATLLSKQNSTYTWYPSRLGLFYFIFNNESLKTCQDSKKLAIKVSTSTSQAPESSALSPQNPPVASSSPGPISGGGVSSSPVYPWPTQPREVSSPSPQPSSMVSDKGGGVPFINSNPAVPLPTGEVDSATFRPLPTSGHGKQVMVGLFAVQMAMFCVALVVL